jgi:hypothetical protein
MHDFLADFDLALRFDDIAESIALPRFMSQDLQF